MTTYAISAVLPNGNVRYFNGINFEPHIPMKEDCNHHDFKKAIQNAPKDFKRISLVKIGHMENVATVEKSEIKRY